ncbi:hypothetical protein J2W51_000313 [Tardiphaga robiniae]|uniref:hypothetical protein n=1 Tax=Tardiphaga robiniae TaxID=943830 RepID=UPI0028549B38|nr:hypothetical protein [Tardiphaga robiniae]MDR6657771.1 hypothetical protein [Tardiphaga robiniae]
MTAIAMDWKHVGVAAAQRDGGRPASRDLTMPVGAVSRQPFADTFEDRRDRRLRLVDGDTHGAGAREHSALG